ncbi:hypothetical protein LR48_Vigan10g229500 [Vigna angularis]|uniref:DNA-directed RNA polymerase n=1 Tax=Phaseolus angularis TaxID=3914 RepID=A0A0L9VN63_PHAAN|nr:hypothetical protein LR48_Vigan10g229500 [Vigna angularis]
MNADLNVKKTQCLQRCVYLAADGGRLCRPLVIVKKGKSKVKKHHIKELFDGELTFDAFLRDGLIEYLDADEQNDVMVTLSKEEATSETTHIQINGSSSKIGAAAGLIPYM